MRRVGGMSPILTGVIPECGPKSKLGIGKAQQLLHGGGII